MRDWLVTHPKTFLSSVLTLFLGASTASIGWTHGASVRQQLEAYAVAALIAFAGVMSIFLIVTHNRRATDGFMASRVRSSPALIGTLFGIIAAQHTSGRGAVMFWGAGAGLVAAACLLTRRRFNTGRYAID